MPKKEIDYSKTIIYKIVCKDISIQECYVGSTTDFIERKYSHKRTCNNQNYKKHNLYIYEFIRANGGWENWDMIEIEKYNAIDKQDQHKRERYYIEALEAKLNKVIPARTHTEYEEMRKKNPTRKQYNLEKSKTNYKENKSKILQQQKEYNEKNKEIISQRRKEYREEHKEEILQKKKEKVICECGCEVNKNHLARHKKSEKHKLLVNP
jgi:hypothetical protein